MTAEQEFVTALSKSMARPGDKKAAIVELGGMVLALMRKIDRLEQRPTLKYSGVWLQGITYSPGEFCTVGGSLFHCQRQTTSRPGTDSTWQLAVKNGSFK